MESRYAGIDCGNARTGGAAGSVNVTAVWLPLPTVSMWTCWPGAGLAGHHQYWTTPRVTGGPPDVDTVRCMTSPPAEPMAVSIACWTEPGAVATGRCVPAWCAAPGCADRGWASTKVAVTAAAAAATHVAV